MVTNHLLTGMILQAGVGWVLKGVDWWRKGLPSRERSHIPYHLKALWKMMIFLETSSGICFLVPWRVATFEIGKI